jgi:hypothetical protein
MTTSIGRFVGIALGAAVFAFAVWQQGAVRTVLQLVGVAAFMGALGLLQRKRPVEHAEWKYLTAGAMEWFGLVLSLGLTGLLAYVFFFVGSARADAAFQMQVLQVLIVAFALSSAYLLYSACMVTTRWNEGRLEQESFGFGRRTICFTDICRLSPLTWADALRIDSVDGTRIYVPLYQNGAATFVAELKATLGIRDDEDQIKPDE